MTIQSLGVCVVLMGVTGAFAAAPTTQPVIPVDQIPVPAPRAPVANAGTPPAADGILNGKVVVLPFEAIGDVENRAWVGRAVQQSLTAEVARLGGLIPVSFTPAGSVDTAMARDSAKAQGGDVVIVGAAQLAGTDIRLTGEIVQVSTGQAIAGLKASGDFRDLFALEDELGSQVRRALRPAPLVATAAPAIDNSMVFGNPAPPAGPTDLFPAPTDQSRFSDQYQHYYTAPADYDPYLYGGIVYPIYGGGTYFPYGNYYGGYGSIVVIHGNGGDRGSHHMNGGNPRPPSAGPHAVGSGPQS